MSGTTSKKQLRPYESFQTPTLFLSGMFDSPAENFHTSENVEIDIERSGADIAIAVQNMNEGYRGNAGDVYTTKEFTPPIFKESIPLKAIDLLKPGIGKNEYTSPAYQAELNIRAMKGARKIEAKIRRSMELQASQVLTLGIVTLIDAAGNTIYTIDYKPKATHLPTAAIAWDNANSVKMTNIISLADVVAQDGLHTPDTLIFSQENWELFVADSAIQNRLNLIDLRQGQIDRLRTPGMGGQFRGSMDIGSYRFDMYTYSGFYIHPNTGNNTRYVPSDKVIMMSSTARMDATFGAIPNFNEILGIPDRRVLPFLPRRMSNQAGGVDMHVNGWISKDGESLEIGVGARPLMIPTAIDTFGCLDTNI